MHWLDGIVLCVYLLAMVAIGIVAMRRNRTQNDYFMGGRSFGKLLQTFAAFGAGTGAHEPITVGRSVWTSGLSGVWSAMLWLFVTPIYWITAIWYRRMRHLTLGDWFVERYDCKALGAAFTLYALAFYAAFLSTMMTAIAKFAVPLLGVEQWWGMDLEWILVPALAGVVILYGVLGGLTAAYWTDLIQGTLIIVLSVLLIPFGLWALVKQYGDPQTDRWHDGFRILHERVSSDFFSLFHGPASGEFPLLFIVSFSLLGLVGIVVHPHFIATGGGSAKSENEARIGLVAGNFLKRLCTVGWALTALIALALLAGNVEIALDKDRVWGVAAREILGPLQLGLVGLMFACLMAAMMSSADTYMLVSSALVVRNVVAPYVAPRATEREYVAIGRWTGLILVVGATILALNYRNVLDQFKLAMEIPILFAAPFWLGLYWRRVNAWAVWLTMGFSLVLFFVLPIVLPRVMPDLRTHAALVQTTPIVVTTTLRAPTLADRARWDAWHTAQQQIQSLSDAARREAAIRQLGPQPYTPQGADLIAVTTRTGGQAIFWQDGIESADGSPLTTVTVDQWQADNQLVVVQAYEGALRGKGQLNLDFLIYQWLGVDLSAASKATLETLRIPTRIVLPFVVLIALSFVTPRQRAASLDRYFVKMKTVVARDPEVDRAELEKSYQDPKRFEHLRLFPGTDWECCRPRWSDVIGVVVSLAICFLIVGLLMWLAGMGA